MSIIKAEKSFFYEFLLSRFHFVFMYSTLVFKIFRWGSFIASSCIYSIAFWGIIRTVVFVAHKQQQFQGIYVNFSLAAGKRKNIFNHLIVALVVFTVWFSLFFIQIVWFPPISLNIVIDFILVRCHSVYLSLNKVNQKKCFSKQNKTII